MKLFGNGVYLGLTQRTAKDGKVYTNVNVDFDGDIQSLNAVDPAPFLNLEKYKPYVFNLDYRTYQKDGAARSYLALVGVSASK